MTANFLPAFALLLLLVSPEMKSFANEAAPKATLQRFEKDAMTKNDKRATIARIWRGRTRRDRADEYERYNYEVGIKPLIEKALGVQTLREDRTDDTEFVTISYWENIEAMARFTGGDPKRIHHLPRDPEFLIELPKSVQILEIRASHGNVGGDHDSADR